MSIDWDEAKAISNLKKHGLSFEEAATVFLDPVAITFLDSHEQNEGREVTIGHSTLGKLLLVVHVERTGQVIRIISARKATKRERKFYEEGI